MYSLEKRNSVDRKEEVCAIIEQSGGRTLKDISIETGIPIPVIHSYSISYDLDTEPNRIRKAKILAVDNGQVWCWYCRKGHDVGDFGRDVLVDVRNPNNNPCLSGMRKYAQERRNKQRRHNG